MTEGYLFTKEIAACGTTQEYAVRMISPNLYEARTHSNTALLWKEEEHWKCSSAVICEEAAQLIGLDIEQYLATRKEN